MSTSTIPFGLEGANVPLRITRGVDGDRSVRITESGAAKDLTGYSARFRARAMPKGADLLELTSGAGEITIAAASGLLTLHFLKADTEGLPASGIYMLDIIDGDGKVERLIDGPMAIGYLSDGDVSTGTVTVETATSLTLAISSFSASLAFADLTGTPTTLAGYGIADAYTTTQVDTLLSAKADTATTLAGYGITDAYTETEVDTALALKANLAGAAFTGAVSVASGQRLYVDGGSDTYITEQAGALNAFSFFAGGTERARIDTTAIRPGFGGTMSLGLGGARFTTVFAAQGDFSGALVSGAHTPVSAGLALGTLANPWGDLQATTATISGLITATAGVTMPNGARLTLDSNTGSDVYIVSPANNEMEFWAGGTKVIGIKSGAPEFFSELRPLTGAVLGAASRRWPIFASTLDVGSTLAVTGAAFIGDTANSEMTLGLTINQGANDNEILAFKSSDVSHGMTADGEADTWGAFRKASATVGGVNLRGFSTSSFAFFLSGYATTEDTAKTTAALANTVIAARKKGAGSTSGDHGADANLFAIRNNATTLFIWDADGDSWHTAAGAGVCVTTPDGTKKYRIAVDNAGAVTTTLI